MPDEMTRREEVLCILRKLDDLKDRVMAADLDENAKRDERIITILAAQAVAQIEVAKALTRQRMG